MGVAWWSQPPPATCCSYLKLLAIKKRECCQKKKRKRKQATEYLNSFTSNVESDGWNLQKWKQIQALTWTEALVGAASVFSQTCHMIYFQEVFSFSICVQVISMRSRHCFKAKERGGGEYTSNQKQALMKHQFEGINMLMSQSRVAGGLWVILNAVRRHKPRFESI